MTDMPRAALRRSPNTSEGDLLVRTRGRRRLGLGAALSLLVVALIVFTIWFWPKHPASPARTAASEAIPVLVDSSATGDVPIYLDGLGTVQAFNTVTVKPMVDGPLTSVTFKEGQSVRAGDVLARIDPRPYQATLDQDTAKKAQDEALLANARLDLVRYQKLASTAYTSAQTADTQRATVAQDAAIVRQDQAVIDNARVQLGYTTITAPIDGRTGLRTVDQGNIVHSTDTTGLTVITQLHPISVVFTLPQQQLPAVAAAMRAGAPEVIATTAGDASAGRGQPDVLDHGKLAVLDNQVDSTTGTIKLKATFPNQHDNLWPGGFVHVRLRVATERGVVTVPPAAIQRGPQGAYVYVVQPDATVKRQAVTVGHEDESVSVVTAGLPAGARVVVDGASRLTDGTKVSVSAPPQAVAVPDAAAPSAPGAGRASPARP